MNVPALSERTLRRDIEKSTFSTGPEIQVAYHYRTAKCGIYNPAVILLLQTPIPQSAVQSNPGAWWWIKGDGVDVVKGLWESTLGEWSGDADLNDGKLAGMYASYKQRLSTASQLGLDERSTPNLWKQT